MHSDVLLEYMQRGCIRDRSSTLLWILLCLSLIAEAGKRIALKEMAT